MAQNRCLLCPPTQYSCLLCPPAQHGCLLFLATEYRCLLDPLPHGTSVFCAPPTPNGSLLSPNTQHGCPLCVWTPVLCGTRGGRQTGPGAPPPPRSNRDLPHGICWPGALLMRRRGGGRAGREGRGRGASLTRRSRTSASRARPITPTYANICKHRKLSDQPFSPQSAPKRVPCMTALARPDQRFCPDERRRKEGRGRNAQTSLSPTACLAGAPRGRSWRAWSAARQPAASSPSTLVGDTLLDTRRPGPAGRPPGQQPHRPPLL